MRKILVAVYGSLRKNMGNDHYLTDAEYLGEFQTSPIYTLHSLGGYPGLKQNGTTSVTMEVYAVNEQEAKNIDSLEGYSPNRKATFYDKIIIDTPYGEAGTYIYVDDLSDRPMVESGDWKEYKTQKQASYYSVTNN